MRDISISQFKQMKVSDIKETGSFNLVAEGVFVAIVVVPASAERKYQIQSIADMGNRALGKE